MISKMISETNGTETWKHKNNCRRKSNVEAGVRAAYRGNVAEGPL